MPASISLACMAGRTSLGMLRPGARVPLPYTLAPLSGPRGGREVGLTAVLLVVSVWAVPQATPMRRWSAEGAGSTNSQEAQDRRPQGAPTSSPFPPHSQLCRALWAAAARPPCPAFSPLSPATQSLPALLLLLLLWETPEPSRPSPEVVAGGQGGLGPRQKGVRAAGREDERRSREE